MARHCDVWPWKLSVVACCGDGLGSVTRASTFSAHRRSFWLRRVRLLHNYRDTTCKNTSDTGGIQHRRSRCAFMCKKRTAGKTRRYTRNPTRVVVLATLRCRRALLHQRSSWPARGVAQSCSGGEPRFRGFRNPALSNLGRSRTATTRHADQRESRSARVYRRPSAVSDAAALLASAWRSPHGAISVHRRHSLGDCRAPRGHLAVGNSCWLLERRARRNCAKIRHRCRWPGLDRCRPRIAVVLNVYADLQPPYSSAKRVGHIPTNV